MASDVVQKIKEAEAKAEEIISASKDEAKKILADAKQQAIDDRRALDKKLKDEANAALEEAAKKAQKISDIAKTGAQQQCEGLRQSLSEKKEKAVELVINEILK